MDLDLDTRVPPKDDGIALQNNLSTLLIGPEFSK